MAVDRGSEAYTAVRRVVDWAEAHTGRRSRWSGELDEITGHPGVSQIDGLIGLDRTTLRNLTPRRMWGLRPNPTKVLEAYGTVLHEAGHLLAGDRDPALSEIPPFAQRQSEEGVVESWAHHWAGRMCADLGLEASAPGVSAARFRFGHPTATLLTSHLVSGLTKVAEHNGTPTDRDALLDQLVGGHHTQKMHALARVTGEILEPNVTPARLAADRPRVLSALTEYFETVDHMPALGAASLLGHLSPKVKAVMDPLSGLAGPRGALTEPGTQHPHRPADRSPAPERDHQRD